MKTMNILVAQGQGSMPGIAEVLREVDGAQVTRCTGDLPHFDLSRKNVFDVLLLDLRNARGDIPPVVERFRRAYPDVPVVVAAGDNTADLALQVLKRGGCDFVVHPQDNHQLQLMVRQLAGSHTPEGHDGAAAGGFTGSNRPTLYEMERNFILRTLEECKWNKKKTASLLGINRSSLYSKIRRFGIGSESNN
jgi:DNA-binding NtrC family response regulator